MQLTHTRHVCSTAHAASLFKASNGFPRMDSKPANFDASAGFGLDPTSLECSILSSMLHEADSNTMSGDSPDVPTAPSMDLMDSYTHFNNVPANEVPEDQSIAPNIAWDAQQPQPPMRPLVEQQVPSDFGKMPIYQDREMPGQFEDQRLLNSSSSLNSHSVFPTNQLSQADKNPPAGRSDDAARSSEHDHLSESAWKQRVSKVYSEHTEPFRYTEGYHILLKYVTQKYEKADVLRIVRALAIFRPSLIALQMALSKEDEIFVERAFQRTILEFEKLISFSGTPTVVWRRTCEICLVGAEFCMLTQWSKEDLVGKYIYQFMDKESVLNYWYASRTDVREQFASHAFENTTPSVMTTCVLLNPAGKPIPCTWCFTIKRDPFDLPAYVVGNVCRLAYSHSSFPCFRKF